MAMTAPYYLDIKSERSNAPIHLSLQRDRRAMDTGYAAQSYPFQSRRSLHAPPSSGASLPGLTSLLQSSGSPLPASSRLDAAPLDGNNARAQAARQHRTASWSSTGSPLDSPLVHNWVGANAQHASHHQYNQDHHHYARAHQAQPQQPQFGRHGRSSPLTPHEELSLQAAFRHQYLQRHSPVPMESAVSSTSSTASADGDEDSSVRGETPAGSVGKNSRYLREMDRRAILERLAKGEKQATLAKEYQVSRAAICNLNKHRDEVMSRVGENPFAKHPKKRKTRPVATPPSDPVVESTATVDESIPVSVDGAVSAEISTKLTLMPTVHVVKSRAVQLLLTKLRSQSTPMAEFRRCSERVLRLVIEDALAHVPTKPVDVFLNDQVKVEGVGMEHAPCAISMEQRQCPMMDMFHLIEPDQPTGYVRLCADQSITLLDAHLPSELRYHNVFLFDTVATSGEAVCAAVQQLKDRGAVESMLHIVALFVASEVVAMVQCKFPGVQIVTTLIDSSLNSKTNRRSHLDTVLVRLEHVFADNGSHQPAVTQAHDVRR